MNEDLHKIDNLFYNSLEPHEETPSPLVWEALHANLDKNDLLAYKNKFILLRRMVAVLIFMLSFLVIHETGFIENGYNVAAYHIEHTGSTDKKTKAYYDSTEKILVNKPGNKLNFSTINMQVQRNKQLQKKATDNTMGSGTYKKENILTDENNTAILNRDNTNYSKKIADSLGKNLPDSLLNKQTNIYTRQQPQEDTERAGSENKLTGIKKTAAVQNDSPVLQVAKKTAKTKGKAFVPYWAATVFAKREWAQYNLENDVQENSNNQTEDNRTAITKREKHEPSYTFGVLATYQFQKKLSFQTGLSYSNTAIAIEPQKVFAVKDYNGGISYKYNTSSGYAFLKTKSGTSPILGDSLYTTAAQHNLEYISIPVLMRYRILHKKISLSAGIGFAVNLLTAAKIQTEIQNISSNEIVSVNRLQGMKSFYTDALANADVQYNIKGNWSVNLITSFRFALSSINKNNIVKTFPYSFGLGLECTYKF